MYKHLYNIFKPWFHNKPEQTNEVFFISDTHFADPDMKLRKNYIGDEEQVKRINARVGKNDTLVILGDIGDVEWVKKIKAGYKVLIMGNHDKGVSNYLSEEISSLEYQKLPKFREYYNKNKDKFVVPDQDNFNSEEEMEKYMVAKLANAFDEVYLEPFKNEGLFDEVYEGVLMISPKIMLSHEPVDFKYAFNIHGHDHSNWTKNENSLNLCAEHINYTPISLNEIVKSGMLKNIPDIHRETIDEAIEKKENKRKTLPKQPRSVPSRLPEREDGKALTQKQLDDLIILYGLEVVNNMLENAKCDGDLRNHGRYKHK